MTTARVKALLQQCLGQPTMQMLARYVPHLTDHDALNVQSSCAWGSCSLCNSLDTDKAEPHLVKAGKGSLVI